MFQHKCRHSLPQTTLDNSRQSCGMGISIYFASNPYFTRISVWKAHSTAYLFDPRKKSIFQILRARPPLSVVFLNCCATFFCNGLKDFKLKYGHHENVVSLFSNHKINETSCLVNFAKKYYLIWDQYNFFQKVFKTRYKHYKTIGNKIRSILVWFKLI